MFEARDVDYRDTRGIDVTGSNSVKPTDRPALQSINGIGKAKLEKYADELLSLLA